MAVSSTIFRRALNHSPFAFGRLGKRTDALLLLVFRLAGPWPPSSWPDCRASTTTSIWRLNRPDRLADLLDHFPLAVGVVLVQLGLANLQFPVSSQGAHSKVRSMCSLGQSGGDLLMASAPIRRSSC